MSLKKLKQLDTLLNHIEKHVKLKYIVNIFMVQIIDIRFGANIPPDYI